MEKSPLQIKQFIEEESAVTLPQSKIWSVQTIQIDYYALQNH